MIATAGFKYVDWDMARFKGSSKQGKESDEETVKYYENLRNICDANGLTVCMSHAIYPTYSEKNQADVLKRIEKCFIASNILLNSLSSIFLLYGIFDRNLPQSVFSYYWMALIIFFVSVR